MTILRRFLKNRNKSETYLYSLGHLHEILGTSKKWKHLGTSKNILRNSKKLQATKTLRDEGKIRAIYRETGVGVLAIFETGDATEMDQILTQLPMAPYFKEINVNVIWDMSPILENL